MMRRPPPPGYAAPRGYAQPSGPPGHPPARPPIQTGRPRGRRRWGRRLLIFFSVLLLIFVGFLVYVDRSLVRVDALSGGRVGDTPGTNWLIVGSDSRQDLTAAEEKELATGNAAGSRTDTIMLLHSGSGPTTLVSLPRDSLVNIPGKGRNKLNAAFSFGGADLLVKTVEQATGVHIDHYAEIGFGGFVDVVDAVGGVDMCIPEAMRDPLAGLNLKAGCQTLNGGEALGYVRTRQGGAADLDRIRRQREFLSALMDSATSPATLLNPFRLVPMAKGLAGAITVDSGDHAWHLLGLALALRGVSSGSGITTTVPIGGTGGSAVGSVVTWDEAAAKKLFGALARDEAPPASVLSGGG